MRWDEDTKPCQKHSVITTQKIKGMAQEQLQQKNINYIFRNFITLAILCEFDFVCQFACSNGNRFQVSLRNYCITGLIWPQLIIN